MPPRPRASCSRPRLRHRARLRRSRPPPSRWPPRIRPRCPTASRSATPRPRQTARPASRRRRDSRIMSWPTARFPVRWHAAWRCSASSEPKATILPTRPKASRPRPGRTRTGSPRIVESSMRLSGSNARANAARIAALTLLLGAGIALGAEPKDWLERMNQALTTGNYVGVFTHVRGSRAESLKIIHRVKGGQVTERLLSLDGSGREFIRKDDDVTCYLPDQRRVLVERRSPDGPLLGALPAIEDDTAQVYEIRGGDRQRLLNRTTRVVALHPRDEYRYGYRLWIDEQTAMPLKTQLCDKSGAVIEQILFSTID